MEELGEEGEGEGRAEEAAVAWAESAWRWVPRQHGHVERLVGGGMNLTPLQKFGD